MAAAQTIRLLTDGSYNTTLTPTDGAVNRGRIVLDSTRNDRTSAIATGAGSFLNAPTGVIESVAGGGGGRLVSGTLVNQGLVDVAADSYLSVVGTYEAAGGRIEGPGNLIDAQIKVTASPAAETDLRLFGTNTRLLTDNLPNTVLHLLTDGSYNTTLTSASGFANHGTIRLDSTRNDRTSAVAVTAGALTNAADGLIDVLTGGGGGRAIAAELVNAGRVNFYTGTTLGRPGANPLNNGFIHVFNTTATFTGASFTNEVGGVVGGGGTFNTWA